MNFISPLAVVLLLYSYILLFLGFGLCGVVDGVILLIEDLIEQFFCFFFKGGFLQLDFSRIIEQFLFTSF